MRPCRPSLGLLHVLLSRCCTTNTQEMALVAAAVASVVHSWTHVRVLVWATPILSALHGDWCEVSPSSAVPSTHCWSWRGVSQLASRCHELWLAKILKVLGHKIRHYTILGAEIMGWAIIELALLLVKLASPKTTRTTPVPIGGSGIPTLWAAPIVLIIIGGLAVIRP